MERFDQYILLKKVGTGGMAELFKAKKVGIEGFERVLAIKRILPHLVSDQEFIEMFIAEAKLAARLSHKNIVQIYDFGKSDQKHFIAMEYVPGKDLRTILRRCRAKNLDFPLPLAIHIAKEVACALHCAHTQKDGNGKNLNIIHRDISPQNILVSYEGEVKVVDFGIAKAESHSRTSTGVLKGKLAYMSPEQAWGKGVDHRSDIFSLGICLYEMLTGERLFKGDSEINTLEKVREAAVLPLPSSLNTNVIPMIEAKVLKALAKDPGERYQSAADMEWDLNAALFQTAQFDPAGELRQFMHDLFQAEIEEEDWVDSETTLHVEDEADHGPRSKSHGLSGRTEAQPEAEVKPTGRPRLYVYGAVILLAAALSIGGGIYLFGSKSLKSTQTVAGIAPSPPPKDSAKPSEQPSPSSKVSPGPPSASTPSTPSPPPSPIERTPEPKASPARQTAPEPKAVVSPEPAAPRKGSLAVDARPAARVFVDGADYGPTPQTLKDLQPGKHTVRLESPEHGSWQTTVTISDKKTARLFHEFRGHGTLVVNAIPWANLFVDGKPQGTTPKTLERVPSGEHVIKFSREGFVEVTQTISLKPSEKKTLSVSLQKKEN